MTLNDLLSPSIALSLGLMASATVFAQTQPAADDSATTGPYAGFSLGRSHSNIDGDDVGGALARQGAGGVTGVDKNGTGYGLNLGYRLHRNFAVEGGYTDLGRFDYTTAPAGGGSVGGRLKADAWHLSGVAIAPFGNGWSAYGKAGIARTRARLSAGSTGGAPPVQGASERGTHPTVGLGVGYDFARQWTAKAEWNRFFKVGDAATTGRGDVDLLSVGLNYRF